MAYIQYNSMMSENKTLEDGECLLGFDCATIEEEHCVPVGSSADYYYKQIYEGYEDQSLFEIMQKVSMTRCESHFTIYIYPIF